jgi:hypothetical protein
MVTTLPQVRVSPVEAQRGYTATCSACTWQILRPVRRDADIEAVEHRASHGTPLREDDDTPWRID